MNPVSTKDNIIWDMVGRMKWRCVSEDGCVGEYAYLPESGMYEWRYSTDGKEFEIGFCDDMTEAMLIVESKFQSEK